MPGFKLIKNDDPLIVGFSNAFAIQTETKDCFILRAEGHDELKKWLHTLKKYHKLEKKGEELGLRRPSSRILNVA
jgi:hypothetical protein